jgi:hypothetical protein
MLILAAQSYSACRAAHFWLIFSLREHPGAFRARIRKSSILTEMMSTRVFEIYPTSRHPWISGIPRKSGVLQGSLYLSREESLGNSIFSLFWIFNKCQIRKQNRANTTQTTNNTTKTQQHQQTQLNNRRHIYIYVYIYIYIYVYIYVYIH